MTLPWLTTLVLLITVMYTMQKDQEPTTKHAQRCLLDDIGATSNKRHRTEKSKIMKMSGPPMKNTKDDYEFSKLLNNILKYMKGNKQIQLKGNYRRTIENGTVSYLVKFSPRFTS